MSSYQIGLYEAKPNHELSLPVAFSAPVELTLDVSTTPLQILYELEGHGGSVSWVMVPVCHGLKRHGGSVSWA